MNLQNTKPWLPLWAQAPEGAQSLSLPPLSFFLYSKFLNELQTPTTTPHTHAHTRAHKDTPKVYKYKAQGRLLFRSLRVPSSSLPGAVFLQVVLCFPFQYSKFLTKPHTRTHTYSVQLQNQERHSVQEPQSTKQLSPGAVPLQVVLCFPFQYSKFLSKPHTRTHTRTYSVQLQSQERHSVQEPQEY